MYDYRYLGSRARGQQRSRSRILVGEGPLNLGQVLYLPKDELGSCEVHSTPKKKVKKVVAEFLSTGVPHS